MNTNVVKKNKNYKAINRTAAADKKLSLKAKGVMFYFLSKPDDWKGHVYDIVNNSRDGRKSVLSAIKELKAAGYITTETDYASDGAFLGKYYKILDEPSEEK